MQNSQKAGAIGALVAAGTFVIGLAMYATVLLDYTASTDPSTSVAFLAEHHLALYAWNIIITIVFGIAMVPLVLALRDRSKAGAPALSRAAAVFGLIWVGLIMATGMIVNVGFESVLRLNETDPAMAATVWAAVDTVANGLGGGNEIVGGIWVLLVTAAASRTRALARWIGHLGLGTGLAGLVTVIPGLQDVGAVFGLSLIVWFGAVGVTLLRTPRAAGHTSPSLPEAARNVA